MAIRRIKRFVYAPVWVFALTAFGLIALFGLSPAAAQETESATITGLVQVEYPAEAPLSGVAVDRFEALDDGTRGAYLDTAFTGDDGIYTFTVEPGDWLLTFIAPEGEVWDDTGNTWVNTAVTVAAGEVATVNQEIDTGIDPVVAVDDEYTFDLGQFVDVDLTANDTVIRELGSVNYVSGSGDLPPGMSISFPEIGGDRRSLQGTPTTPGTYNFQYQVSNERGTASVGNVTVTVLSDSSASISGVVRIGFPVDGPAENVQVELFTAQADGTRGSYVSSTVTAADGSYSFTVEPGVWVLTFISPSPDLTWEASGQQWLNVPLSVAGGENATVDQTLDTGLTPVQAVDDEYNFTVGIAADVDLSANDIVAGDSLSIVFESGDLPPGMRLSFPFLGGDRQTLQGVPTTPGVYNFEYRVSSSLGSDTGAVTVTVEAGDFGVVSGLVNGLAPGVSVTVDVFSASPDGTRDDYLRSIVVDGPSDVSAGGEYLLQLDPGQYVLTFIAPNPQSTWESTGTMWSNLPVTVQAGEFQTVEAQNLLFVPPPVPGTIQGTVMIGFPAEVAADGVQVDLFTAQADGSRGTYVSSTTTDGDGSYSFTVDPGVWVLTFVSPDPTNLRFESSNQIWVNVPLDVEPGEVEQVDQLLVFDVVQPVDDEYNFVVGSPVVVDLTVNDQVITQVSRVEYVIGSGDLPPGLSISFGEVGGVYEELRGTPTTPGVYNFQYSVSNERGDSDVGNVMVTVTEP